MEISASNAQVIYLRRRVEVDLELLNLNFQISVLEASNLERLKLITSGNLRQTLWQPVGRQEATRLVEIPTEVYYAK